jgi:hypothetical protein
LVAGWVVLQQTSMTGMSTVTGSATTVGYFLLALGAVVFLTGIYVLVTRIMRGRAVGLLMLTYGVIMLTLGVGMMARFINLMMEGSSMISGVAMILSGIAMLYSGLDMRNRKMM